MIRRYYFYFVETKPFYKTIIFGLFVIGVLQAVSPIILGSGRGTIIKSQLGLISEQECVEEMTQRLNPGHAIPCGSLIRIMGEAIGGAETDHTRRMAEKRQKSWDRIDRAIEKQRGF